MNNSVSKREDLIGKSGVVTKQFEIVDAKESILGTYIRIKKSDGEEYWTTLNDEILLD